MRFRWKLLILLIVIAVLPILAMRTFGARSTRTMAAQLISETRQNVISDTKSRLALFIDSYAQLLWQKRKQLEMALAFQAEAVSRALSADVPGSGQPTGPADGPRLNTVMTDLAGISQRLGGLVLWQCTVLKNGVTAVYPDRGELTNFNPMQQPWYARALDAELFWSEQFRDPLSGQNVMALSMPVRDSEGMAIGVTAFMISINRLLESREILKHLPEATQSFLVALVPNPASGKSEARIFARQAHGAAAGNTWSSPSETDWLVADDPAQYEAVLTDLKYGRSNVRRVSYNSCDCLWVYGPVHQDAFLLLTTPYRQILHPIDEAERFIRAQIDDLIGVTRLGILFILAAVVGLAFAFARTVSKPMQILAEGAQRLAEGHFDTRVEIKSNDEFGEMGKVFNAVGPQLEAHARFQQTMELAREVQQHFLPGRAPAVPGLDIAGKSNYCDEIGGDYFDFIDPGDGSNRIGVVIGDVSGHGIPSALLMTTARALLRQRLSLSGSLRQVIADVNVRLCRDIEESGQFMTLFYADLSPHEKTLRWVRAGHDPALLYHPDADRFEELMGEGTSLGVSCDVRFEEHRQSISTGHILLLTTDGIREARDPDGNMFGSAPVREIVRTHAEKSAANILDAIMRELEAFRGPQGKMEDDATLVVVKVT